MRRPTALALVAVLGAALPAAVEPAVSPPDRIVSFGSLPRGWFEAIPRDVRKQARIVTLTSGQRLAVAPTRNGNFCEAFRSFGGCRARPGYFRGRIYPMVGASTTARNRRVIAIGGSVIAPPDHTLYLVHRDGAVRRLPLTYVTRPIDAGFFYASIPQNRQRGPSAPVRIQLRRGQTVIESQSVGIPPRR